MKAYWIGCMCGDDTEPEPLKHASTCPISREARRATAVPKCDTCGRFARRLSAVAMPGSVTPDFRCPTCHPIATTARATATPTQTTPATTPPATTDAPPSTTAAAEDPSSATDTEEPTVTPTPTATETVPTDIQDVIDQALEDAFGETP